MNLSSPAWLPDPSLAGTVDVSECADSVLAGKKVDVFKLFKKARSLLGRELHVRVLQAARDIDFQYLAVDGDAVDRRDGLGMRNWAGRS